MRNSVSISPGQALWNHRETIASLCGRFKALSAAVGRPTDLNLYQWVQIAAFALEFRPDLIIELGRGFGNSTCCFIEVAHRLGGAGACRVLSLCLTDDWLTHTVPRLKEVVPPDWFAPAQIEVRSMLEYDVKRGLAGANRCLVFWDAHGFDIAEWVLGRLLPQLIDKRHLVLMHDMSDNRFEASDPKYGEQGLWLGTDETIWRGAKAISPSFWLGHIVAKVPQAISILDFTSRNRLPLRSAADSLHAEIGSELARMAELKALLGAELFSIQAHWFWLTLNEASTALTFPMYQVPVSETKGRNSEPQVQPNQTANDLDQLQQAARAQLSEQDINRLMDAVKRYGRELAEMPQRTERLEAMWCEVQDSAGWHLLNAWRGVRDRALPGETRRRELYESVLRYFRGQSSQKSKGQ